MAPTGRHLNASNATFTRRLAAFRSKVYSSLVLLAVAL
jgi:hypothetical protein